MLLISCDWGTSSFRIRLLKGDSAPVFLAERRSDSGISAFPPGSDPAYRDFLGAEIAALFSGAGLRPSPVPVILSGMITSSLGWKQPAYAELPFPLDGGACVVERDQLETQYGGHPLVFISGVKGQAEVLRGEECELIGLYSLPESAGFLQSSAAILPGTHSKVLEIRDAAMVSFRTYLTGELFDVLCRHSILRHSVGSADAAGETGPAFEDGVRKVQRSGLLGSLFSVRARSLLEKVGPDPSRDFLSGLVIGEEISSLLRLYSESVPFVLGGTPRLATLYLRGFEALGQTRRVRVLPRDVIGAAAGLGHWRLARHLIAPAALC
jgi:2-dehydro-3-deoxygalactonokinase